jgi:hypothetical protein
VIDRAPQIVLFPIDLHEHLVEMPPPVAVPPHPAHPLAANIRCERRTEPVSLEPCCLVADVDAPFKQQILDVAQAQRVSDVHHDHQPDLPARELK